MTSSAPRERTKSAFAADASAMTYAPRALATCTARCPTPSAAPSISTRLPSPMPAVSTNACQAVSPGQRDGGGLHVGQALGLGDEHARRGNDVLGVRPVTV